MTATVISQADIDDRWTGYQGLFGGFVAALLVDAAVTTSTYRLVSFSANFVSAVVRGDIEIAAEQVHSGRSTSLTRLALRQSGRVRIHASAEFVNTSSPDPAQRKPWVLSESAVSPPAQWIDQGRIDLPFDELFEVRRTDTPRVHEPTSTWIRVRPEVGKVPGLTSPEAALTVFLDLPTPGLFGDPSPPAFIPTIDYTLHFPPRKNWDPSTWVHIVHSTAWATHSDCADDVKAWDDTGTLVAIARQTRGVRWAER